MSGRWIPVLLVMAVMKKMIIIALLRQRPINSEQTSSTGHPGSAAAATKASQKAWPGQAFATSGSDALNRLGI